MPGLDGPSVAAEIRRREASERRTPIVALSAASLPRPNESLPDKIDEHVVKPVSVPALAALLDRFLARAPERRAQDRIAVTQPALWTRYLSEAAHAVESLRALLAAGDIEALQREAHRLKGSSLFLGATRVAELCARLPPPGESVDEQAGFYLAEMQRELDRLGAAGR